jgi:hypothetical protein
MNNSARAWMWTALAVVAFAWGCSPSDDEGSRDDAGHSDIDSATDDHGGGADSDADGDTDIVLPDIPDTEAEACDQANFNIARVIPDMLIVLDRSNSMFDDGYWNPVRDAIYTVTTAMDTQIWFGLMIFPNVLDSSICSGLDFQCEPGHGPLVPVADANHFAIIEQLGPMLTCGGTPIADTLYNARTYLDTLAGDGHPKYILLATDGAPNCNDALPGGSCRCTSPVALGCMANPGNCLDDLRTNAVLGDLLAGGVQVFVLGIGTSSFADVLDAMAVAGGTEHAYFAEDPATILPTFEDIAGMAATCEFDVSEPDPSADPTLVNFYFDDVAVPGDNTDGTCDDGWGWMNAEHTRVQFCGDYCTAIMTGTVGSIRATWGCPTIIL